MIHAGAARPAAGASNPWVAAALARDVGGRGDSMLRIVKGLTFLVLLISSRNGFAQLTGFERSGRGSVELRLGAHWKQGLRQQELEETKFSGGFRGIYHPIDRVGIRRLSVQFAFDYVPVSTIEFFDQQLGSPARFRDEILIINPALGLDVVQSPHVDLVVRYGGAVVGNRTRFELPNFFGQFQDVCGFQDFEGLCPSRWNFLGNAGVGVRFYPSRWGNFFFGADFTRYAFSRNQLVGTLGWSF